MIPPTAFAHLTHATDKIAQFKFPCSKSVRAHQLSIAKRNERLLRLASKYSALQVHNIAQHTVKGVQKN